MEKIKALNVYIEERKVGMLAEMQDGRIAFEYSESWLKEGYSISSFSLPLETGVFVPKRYESFSGLHGVFAESLPSGFGKRAFDAYFAESGINPFEIGTLNRLACTGKTSRGILSYKPVNAAGKEYATGLENVIEAAEKTYEETEEASDPIKVDELEALCKNLREENETENTETLFAYCGFCGGEKPKANYKIQQEDWIVKFPDVHDAFNMSEQEYAYNFCAAKCGIEIPSCRLIPSSTNLGYFAEKRFDRNKTGRKHVVTAGALLEIPPRAEGPDYDIILRLVIKLTQSFEEAEKMFRLMCFNIFAENRDNGVDNISFVREENGWRLTPAYDLTYSMGKSGEYSIGADGNRKNPGKNELLTIAARAGLNRKKSEYIIDEIKEKVGADLEKYFNHKI